MFKLTFSPASPYVRKVLLSAYRARIQDELEKNNNENIENNNDQNNNDETKTETSEESTEESKEQWKTIEV